MPSFQQHLETLELWRRFPALERIDGARDAVALTFDDGPDPDSTPAVLDALDAAGARATFFLLGEQLMEHRSLGGEIARRGHEVALHGFEHREHSELGPAVRDDLARALGTVEAGTGRRPRWLRPPYGRFSEISYEACGPLGLEPVYWSAWGMDWEPIGPDRIADLVQRDLAAGAIVVLHDSARYAPRASARETADAIAPIASAAGEAGLRLVTLGEAAGG
jgi:peptidoglycan/xylan/chitin deacetylase (PgdA/CDA1 family)